MQILDGTVVRAEIFSRLKPRIANLSRPPGLGVVLAGHDPASEIYVRAKIKACGELGIYSEKITPPESTTTTELLAIVADLNRRPEIDGILVQVPLPRHVDSRRVLESVAAEKDADGFHAVNVGHLVAGRPAPRACTPAGIMEMLRYYGCAIDGRHAVIVGRSDTVGKPMALMLLHANATVTICHSHTSNLDEECRRADILVAAIGKPALVTRDYIAPGAIVIDVGQNRIADGELAQRLGKGAEFAKKGFALVGDVNPIDVLQCASAYTPVPGGVGPLTVAMLMSNTVELAEEHQRAANACA